VKPNISDVASRMRRGVIWSGLVGTDEVSEHLLREVAGEGFTREAGVRGDADESALELADVVGDVGGDVVEGLVGNLGALPFRLLAENGKTGLELGRLHVGDQAPLEPGTESDLEGGDGPRRSVRGNDDLAAGAVRVLNVWKNSSWSPPCSP
jgi:hypothetical protein